MSNKLLLDRESREILAAFLISAERPKLIPLDDFMGYRRGEIVAIPFKHLGEIVDVIGPGILDALGARGVIVTQVGTMEVVIVDINWT